MTFLDFAENVLPAIYVLVAFVLIWLIVELIIVVRNVRKTAISSMDKLKPSMNAVNKITENIEPAIATLSEQLPGIISRVEPIMTDVKNTTEQLPSLTSKVEPMIDRVNLTIDAANLEIVRVDEILENVGGITSSLSSASDAIDKVANAPVKLATGAIEFVKEGVETLRAESQENFANQSENHNDEVINERETCAVAVGAVQDDSDNNSVRTGNDDYKEAVNAVIGRIKRNKQNKNF